MGKIAEEMNMQNQQSTMFVLEDPGKRRPVRERQLTDSNVRSYLAFHKHYHRRRVVRSHSRTQNSPSFSTTVNDVRDRHERSRTRHVIYSHAKSAMTSHHADSLHQPTISHTNTAQDDFANHHRHHNELASPLPPSPRHLSAIACDDTFEETRGLQFFIERTATEWSGWYDSHFWRVIAPQVSTLPCVRHALVSIASVHEAFESKNEISSLEHKTMALREGRKSLSCLSQAYADMSLSSIFVVHILISAFTLFQHEPSCYNATRVMYDFDERLQQSMATAPSTIPQADRSFITNYLHPLVERHRSKLGQLVDLIYCLRNTDTSHFATTEQPVVPISFTSIDHARNSLEELLCWTTFTVKSMKLPPITVPPAAEADLARWLSALHELHKQGNTMPRQSLHNWTERDRCNMDILRLVARIFFMMIRVMNCESEMVFDQYTELYKDTARVFKKIIAYRKSLSRTNFSIATDASFLVFVGNTACRWCRDPIIRQELIELLLESNGRETHGSAVIWAETARCLKVVEEGNTFTLPKTAADIPEISRVRLDAFIGYRAQRIFGVRYVHYPYGEHIDTATAWNRYPHCGTFLPWETEVPMPIDQPDLIIGRGCASWRMEQKSTPEYYTVKEPNFYFNIPKL